MGKWILQTIGFVRTSSLRKTFNGLSFANIYGNLTYATLFDLYDGNCEENPGTYRLMFSPFRFWDYGDELAFWVPNLIVANAEMDSNLVYYHVDQALTLREMLE